MIKPFKPRPFPPRRLNTKIFSHYLKKASALIDSYDAFLRSAPSPKRLFAQLTTLESIASKNPNHEALIWACKAIQTVPIDKKLLCAIHKKTKQNSAIDIGNYRDRQNWIGPVGCTIEEAYFYPPAPDQVDRLMRELLRYIKKREKEPLLQLALSFAQLLIIHPFMDGNGRVARILIPLFLYRKKVLPIPFLFMSDYFHRHRLQYFLNLFKTTEQHRWEAWTVFFLKGMIIEIRRTERLLKKILFLYNETKQKYPGIKKSTLLFLFENPIFSAASFPENPRVLEDLKFIRRKSDKVYYFSSLLKILNLGKKIPEVQKKSVLAR